MKKVLKRTFAVAFILSCLIFIIFACVTAFGSVLEGIAALGAYALLMTGVILSKHILYEWIDESEEKEDADAEDE